MYCTWYTCKKVTVWVLDTMNLTVALCLYMLEQLNAILKDIPHCKHHLSANKWYHVLGDLQSMDIDIPAARVLFRQKNRPSVTSRAGK